MPYCVRQHFRAMNQTTRQTATRAGDEQQELRRNWAGWYPDGEDLIFEQTCYDLRAPALGGLAGFLASLFIFMWLLAQGLPGEPIRNGLYGALLLVNVVALVACGIVARQALRPIHRIARFSRARQSLIVRDVLALGTMREQAYPYPQLGDARLRTERVLSAPEDNPGQNERDHLLAYPVVHIELERRGHPALTMTTGALLSPHAARRGVDTINEHLKTARAPVAPPPQPPAPPPATARAAAGAARRPARRAIPPRPIR